LRLVNASEQILERTPCSSMARHAFLGVPLSRRSA
jgi:hypothetical protein